MTAAAAGVKYLVLDDTVREGLDKDLLDKMVKSGINILSTRQVRSLHNAEAKEAIRAVRRREYYSKPEVQEKRKLYYTRPDVKQHRSEYNKKEEVKERKRQAQKQRSELINRLRETNPTLYSSILESINPDNKQ